MAGLPMKAARAALGTWLLAICALHAACAARSSEPALGAPPSASAAEGASDPALAAARAIVEAPDRTPEDRQTDARRHPLQLLVFIGARPGDRVADLGAGAGYTTELLARAVGPGGVVYAQNDALTLERFVSESWPRRLAREVNRGVVRMDREFEAPLAPQARELDLVTFLFSYHDVVARGSDRSKLNAAVFEALEPGGRYVIADHRAVPGSGVEAARSLHRIDEALVRQEVEAAGFKFVEAAEFLRNDADDGTRPSPQLGFDTDRFLLKFEKPGAS